MSKVSTKTAIKKKTTKTKEIIKTNKISKPVSIPTREDGSDTSQQMPFSWKIV